MQPVEFEPAIPGSGRSRTDQL